MQEDGGKPAEEEAQRDAQMCRKSIQECILMCIYIYVCICIYDVYIGVILLERDCVGAFSRMTSSWSAWIVS